MDHSLIFDLSLQKDVLNEIIYDNSSKKRVKEDYHMIKSWSAANFQSFYEEVRINLTAGKAVQSPERYINLKDGSHVSLVSNVIGHNASGKTALLKAPSFLAWFMAHSFDEQGVQQNRIPVIPHFSHTDETTKLGMEFEIEGVDYRYALEIINDTVIKESLYRKRERFGFIFLREWDPLRHKYTVKSQDFALSKKEAERARPSVSLISTAAQYGEPTAVSISQFFKSKFLGNVQLFGTLPNNAHFDVAINYFATHELANSQLQEMLRKWDLGLAKIDYRREKVIFNNMMQEMWLGEGVHQVNGETHRIAFGFESEGTKNAIVRLNIILQVLNSGGLAIIDEFETGLHPAIVRELISLFSNPAYNLAKGQLLFSSHLPQILNDLDKNQIFLVEKNEILESNAYSLSEVEGVRNSENFSANYLAGAYGAVPII
jgi:uncharacterized protein